MKAILQVFPFSLCATLVFFWPPPVSVQSSAERGGASACAIPAAKLVPDAPAETASNPRSALLRRFAHVRDYVGCLQSHGVRPASSPMAAAAAGTFVTFDVPGGVTFPTAINSVGTIAGTYFDANSVAHSFVRAPDGALTPFDPPGATGGSFAFAIDAEG